MAAYATGANSTTAAAMARNFLMVGSLIGVDDLAYEMLRLR